MSLHTRPPALLPDHPAFVTASVKWVKHRDEHLFSFAIERPASFRFRSGEFVMIGLMDGEKPLMSAYSIASPAWSDELEFRAIKVPDGPLTSRLQGIRADDQLYLGRKPTGTLVADALLPGKRLFMLSTGTGLAPFLSIARDPEIYGRFPQVVIVHSVRRVSDLAYHDELAAPLASDPLVQEQALLKFHYVRTFTREPFRTSGRIGDLAESGVLFRTSVTGPQGFDPESDRVMLCGSTAMIRDFAATLEGQGFAEGSNHAPSQFVIERAFVG